MDKEIILAIITNMGAGLACIVLGFFALIAFLASLKWAGK
jgi:hypothetical protein